MPPLSVLIKPASGACNARCAYCFYCDEQNNRKTGFRGMLSENNTEVLVKKAVEYADKELTFLFQGGEPTLRGLDYFKRFVGLEAEYKKSGLVIHNSIQTNGLNMNEEWARFFKDNSFLVGLSLDGPAEIHNSLREDAGGKGTFNRVMSAAALMNKAGVDFNILSVLTEKSAKKAQKLYSFFKKQGFGYLQFIPCLDTLNTDEKSPHHLKADTYADFLISIFGCWFNDLKHGEYVSIRHIDNILRILMGAPPEMCSACGRCSIQCVVEGDGCVYPCDFYCLDDYCLGNIAENDFRDFFVSETAQSFVNRSAVLPAECKCCEIFALCRNGCMRECIQTQEGERGLNEYCSSYKKFYSECLPELREAAGIIQRANMR